MPCLLRAGLGGIKSLEDMIDVNIRDLDRETALHLVCRQAGQSCDDPARTVRLLVERGADMNALSRNQVSPLWPAVVPHDYSSAEVLLSHGADIDAQYKSSTALIWARRCGQANMAFLLLCCGAALHAADV